MFDYLKKIFIGADSLEVAAPIEGKLIPITQVKDETFAKKVLGDGFAIIPESDRLEVVAPVDGRIDSIFDTKHALAIVGSQKLELIYHFGVDTVKLKGIGIDCHVKAGQRIKRGDKLLDIELLPYQEAGLDITNIIVLVAGLGKEEFLEKIDYRNYRRGEIIGELYKNYK